MTPISVAGKTIADFPEFAKEWDVKKNNNLKPAEVKAGSNIIGWWKCEEGHLSQAQVKYRLRFQTGCKKCRKFSPQHSRGFNKPKAGKSLGDLYPELVNEWDYETNGDITPFDIGAKVNHRFHWVCTVNSKHKWDAEARDRTRGRGCPYCVKKGVKKVLPPDSLAGKYSTLMKLWDYEKNKTSPEEIPTHSSKSFWWKCSKGEDHRWQQKPSVMVGNFTSGHTKRLGGCPFCDGKRVSKTNSLAQLYPDVAKFWHPEKNLKTPDEITAKSDKRVWWYCSNCGLEWRTTPHAKTQHAEGTECPECQLKHISKTEVRLAHEVKAFFECEFGTQTWIRGKEKKWDVDILVRQLGLVIEFDGAYYHQNNHKQDARKTEDLQKKGFKVIRIRETHPKMPLEKITENDIQIATESSIKDISNKLLKQIEKVCNISIDGLNDYLVKKEAVNKSSANEYIARLLKDKHQTTLM